MYETLDLRVARHPSESEEFMCARVVAFCLERREGLAMDLSVTDGVLYLTLGKELFTGTVTVHRLAR